MGLDPQRQGVSWDESESNKKQKGRDKKEAADRYFSTVSRQQLTTETPVPAFPKIPECSDSSFLPLGNDEENKGGETGKRFSCEDTGFARSKQSSKKHSCCYFSMTYKATQQPSENIM